MTKVQRAISWLCEEHTLLVKLEAACRGSESGLDPKVENLLHQLAIKRDEYEQRLSGRLSDV
jgi:hypothetical protein